MDVTNEIHRGRLFRAVESSYKSLEPFRSLNRNLVEEYAGSGYGVANRARFETMVNLMNQAVDAYTMALVANRPRVMIDTKRDEYRHFAKQYEIALNNYIQQIGLEYKLRQWVLDAFFCVGVIKVHMADSGMVQLAEDLLVDPGKPYASNISIDNWVFDSSATKVSEMKYAADMYRIPHEDLKSSIYDQAVASEIVPTSKYPVDDDRLSRITRGLDVDRDEFEPMVDLADVWVARDKKIYTFPVKSLLTFGMYGKPLAVMDWEGPELGPYHLLGFNDVPENIMPTSPASHLANLNRLINNLMRKQSKRARNQKNLHLYTPSGAKGAKEMQKAGDDSFVQVENVEEFRTVPVGALDANLGLLVEDLMGKYDRMAGNLQAMLGLGAQADTASQEQLIHSAVSKKVASMQYRVVDESVKLIRNLGYMLWNDKFMTIRGSRPIEGAPDYKVDMTWTPEDRQGEFSYYDLSIDMHSMPYQSPSAKYGLLIDLLTKVYAPMTNIFMQQGGNYNLQELTNILADLANLPQLREVVQFTAPQVQAPQAGGMQGGDGLKDRDVPMPSTSTRNYVRSGRPQNTNAASVQNKQAWASMAAAQSQE
jgi:hypothetical protein